MAFQLWKGFLQRILVDLTVEKINRVTVLPGVAPWAAATRCSCVSLPGRGVPGGWWHMSSGGVTVSPGEMSSWLGGRSESRLPSPCGWASPRLLSAWVEPEAEGVCSLSVCLCELDIVFSLLRLELLPSAFLVHSHTGTGACGVIPPVLGPLDSD